MRFGRSRRLVVALAGLTLLSACRAGGQAADDTVTSFVTAAPASSVSPTSEPAASPSPSDLASRRPYRRPRPAAPSRPIRTLRPRTGSRCPTVSCRRSWSRGRSRRSSSSSASTASAGTRSGSTGSTSPARSRSVSPVSCPAPTCCPTRRRMPYQGPGHSPGKSSINWNTAADLPVEIADLNQAYSAGNEIGTHFNGHFCEGAEPSGNALDHRRLEQRARPVLRADQERQGQQPRGDDARPGLRRLGGQGRADAVPGGSRRGPVPGADRAQHDLRLVVHPARHLLADEVAAVRDLGARAWPTFPIHGTDHFQITMDYNFYYTQRNASSNGVTPAQSARRFRAGAGHL